MLILLQQKKFDLIKKSKGGGAACSKSNYVVHYGRRK
jgi:hypothetical protein